MTSRADLLLRISADYIYREFPKMSEKSKKTSILLKIVLAVFTLIYPFFNVIMTGAGLVFNHASYGDKVTRVGVFFIISGVLMTGGAVLCMFRRKILNIISAVSSGGGFALCMAMLCRLVSHADRNGWADKFTLTPISDMYRMRIMPVIIPVAVTVFISLVNCFKGGKSE